MAVYGTLLTMPLSDLLAWVKATSRSGVLTVTRDGSDWELVLDRGHVVAYAGPELRDSLGQIVVTSGLLTEEDLRSAYQHQREGGGSLQRALLGKGLITRDELRECLTELARESIYDLFINLPGEFVFTNQMTQPLDLDLEDDNERLPLDLDINQLLMEGARRQDEWTQLRERFPRDDVEVEIMDESLPPLESLGVRERRILAGLSAGQSISDICFELRAPVPSVLRALAALEETGAVRITVPVPGGDDQRKPSRTDRLLQQVELLRQSHQYDEAVALLEVAVRLRPDDEQTRSTLKLTLEEQLKDLYAALPPIKVPVIIDDQRLRKLRLRPEERFLIDRLSARMDIGSLIMVSSMNERETLKTLKRLLHSQVITLR